MTNSYGSQQLCQQLRGQRQRGRQAGWGSPSDQMLELALAGHLPGLEHAGVIVDGQGGIAGEDGIWARWRMRRARPPVWRRHVIGDVVGYTATGSLQRARVVGASPVAVQRQHGAGQAWWCVER